MRLPFRERPSADVLALLEPGERVLSWADTADGGVVVATPRGLWWPFPEGARRIGWQYVSKASWQGDAGLSVVEAEIEESLIHDRPAVSVQLSVPRDLPSVVRKRVNANIVKTELLAVDGGAVRFVGRKVPGEDGLVWWARPEPGTRLSVQGRQAVRARLEILRVTGGPDDE